ncbi:MAG: 30S ribosomal protein S4 [Nanoarchaeota archaeon]
MIRKKKLYVRPRKLYEKGRIKEENILLEKYALKNKREIWKTLAKMNYFKRRARELAQTGEEEQKILFDKLNKIGLNVKNIADVLALKIENLLERRLPTIVFRKKLSATLKQARQMVAHKRVMISEKVVNSPSYVVQVEEENKITLKHKNIKPKKEEIQNV